MENIRYGRLEASEEEVIEAAKIAGAHDFIVTLEKGYDQNVGEGGNLLSVGQKQLISLARAVLARPELFISPGGGLRCGFSAPRARLPRR